jgi:hypothetical protein
VSADFKRQKNDGALEYLHLYFVLAQGLSMKQHAVDQLPASTEKTS